MGDHEPAERTEVTRLVGVYDADGTVLGELASWIGARLGRRHCSLCDITHGSVRERPDWKVVRAGLPVPFETYHRDDQPADVRQATAGRLPAVVAITGDGVAVVMGPELLETCAGSIERFVDLLCESLAGLGLTLPAPSGSPRPS